MHGHVVVFLMSIWFRSCRRYVCLVNPINSHLAHHDLESIIIVVIVVSCQLLGYKF